MFLVLIFFFYSIEKTSYFSLSSEIILTNQTDNKRPIYYLGENGNYDIRKTPMWYLYVLTLVRSSVTSDLENFIL